MAASHGAPPSYQQATGSSTASSSFLQVPQTHNGIPAAHRRSMEDEQRPLPAGWVRQWDVKEQHQFFVNTKADPPTSIWHHPYDDDAYLKTLSSEERESIQEAERERLYHSDVSDDEPDSKDKHDSKHSTSTAAATVGAASSSASTSDSKKKGGFGSRLKDKVTGSTKEEREATRREREREEAEYYEAHMHFRQAMQRAQATGQPQLFARDKDGKNIYIEPPQSMYGGGGYGGRGYGYNPYSSGPYADPNARFIRPPAPYGRPYGRGYGGGMGLPVAGGLLGGMMLGGLLF